MCCNCWTYALRKWLKNPGGTYLVIRRSKHCFWPHVFFAESIENLVVEEYKPIKAQKGIRAIFHAICFKGRIRKGMGEE